MGVVGLTEIFVYDDTVGVSMRTGSIPPVFRQALGCWQRLWFQVPFFQRAKDCKRRDLQGLNRKVELVRNRRFA